MLGVFAKARNSACAAGIVKKFYENVSHKKLRKRGQAESFNLLLVMALCYSYAGRRVYMVGKAAPKPMETGGTIVAGCACAVVLSKFTR